MNEVFLKKKLYLFILCMWGTELCPCDRAPMVVRGQLARMSSLLAPCVSRRLNSSCRAWWQVLYPLSHLACSELMTLGVSLENKN